MGRPWADAGWAVYCFDLLNYHKPIEHRANGGFIAYIEADLDDPEWVASIKDIIPSIMFSFSPCDDLTVSGAKHFESKLAADPDCQALATRRAKLIENIANDIGCIWMHENPVSILSSTWREADFSFNPSDYGGYLPADDIHPRWPEYIAPRDAYPKHTMIRCGNGFIEPMRKPVDCPPGWSAQKSRKTKQIRSETPRGFARGGFCR